MSQAEAPATPRQPIVRQTPSLVIVEPSVPPPEPLGPPCPVIVERTPSLVITESPHLPPQANWHSSILPPPEGFILPTYRDLPCEDGSMENAFDHAQSALLKDSLLPVLRQLHPNGLFCVTHDTAIFFRTNEVHRSAAIVPDWCYVPGLSMLIENNEPRPSFLTWQENVFPVLLLEYISQQEHGERDRTPHTGKFWIYEHVIRPTYYGIYDVRTEQLEVYGLSGGNFELLAPNDHGRYLIKPLGLELGLWTGDYQGVTLPWLRWFEPDGRILPTSEESAEQERQRAEQERQRAEQERQRAEQERQNKEKFAAKLRELGIDPDQL